MNSNQQVQVTGLLFEKGLAQHAKKVGLGTEQPDVLEVDLREGVDAEEWIEMAKCHVEELKSLGVKKIRVATPVTVVL